MIRIANDVEEVEAFGKATYDKSIGHKYEQRNYPKELFEIHSDGGKLIDQEKIKHLLVLKKKRLEDVVSMMSELISYLKDLLLKQTDEQISHDISVFLATAIDFRWRAESNICCKKGLKEYNDILNEYEFMKGF